MRPFKICVAISVTISNCDIVKQTLSDVRGFCDMAVIGVESKCFRRTRCCDMNEFVNAGEVENENRRGRVKVVKIRIGSGNDEQN